MVIKSKFKDFLHTIKGLFARNKYLSKKEISNTEVDKIALLANDLHPSNIVLTLSKIETLSNPLYKAFYFTPSVLPPYKAGDAISIKFKVNDVLTSRPYSLTTSYSTAKENNEIKIIVKKQENGFISNYLFNEAKIGDKFDSVFPFGNFNYNEIKDKKDVCLIAGGIGITPFLSFIDAVEKGELDINITLIYGVKNLEEVVDIKSNKIKKIIVTSDKKQEGAEFGLIDKELIKKYELQNSTFFMCGPKVMDDFVRKELLDLGVNPKGIIVEMSLGQINFAELKDYPKDVIGKTFSITIIRGINKEMHTISYNETVLQAIEKSSIYLNSKCRNGVCGACHTKLNEGKVFVLNKEYIRKADLEMGYYHACTMYPLSDLVVTIPAK